MPIKHFLLDCTKFSHTQATAESNRIDDNKGDASKLNFLSKVHEVSLFILGWCGVKNRKSQAVILKWAFHGLKNDLK